MTQISRRAMVAATGVAATGLVAACSGAVPSVSASSGPAQPGSVLSAAGPPIPKTGMHVVTLGTKGGPTVRADRVNPSNLVVVDGRPYVVDCGLGVTRQLVLAGVALADCREVFITHHHSDHNLEFGNLAISAWNANLAQPVTFHGPAPMSAMLGSFLETNRFDIDVRISDQGLPDVRTLVRAQEIAGPGVVFQDDRVRVTAALNNHPPLTQSYAFRFDTKYGSVVFSGDTTPTESVLKLAADADWLIHEVLHLPSLDALLKSQPTELNLKQHLIASHTTNEQVGQVALDARVKNLVLSHFVSFGQVSDQDWERDSRGKWRGNLIVARDLQLVF